MWMWIALITLPLVFMAVWIKRWVPESDGDFAECEGLRFQVQRKSDALGQTVVVGLAAPAAIEFQMRPEHEFDHASQRFGLVDEVQTGDSRFDELIYVISDHLQLRAALQAQPALREAVLNLHAAVAAAGWSLKELRVVELRLYLRATHEDTEAASPDTAAWARQLESLRQLLPTASGDARFDRKSTRAHVLLTLCSALLVTGIVSMFGLYLSKFPRLVDSVGLRNTSIVCALIAALLLAALSWAWLKRSSRTHYVLAELLSIGLIVVWMWSFIGLRELNIRGPQANAIVVERAVADRFVKQGRRSLKYFLRFAAEPRHGLPELDMAVSEKAWEQASNGDCHGFRLYPGALGWPWLDRIAKPAVARVCD